MTAEDERLRRVAHAAIAVTSLAFELGSDGWDMPGLPIELIEHFAAFNPPTVLGLLDRVAAAEAKVERVTVLRDNWARLAGQAIDRECREWRTAASTSLRAALDGAS